MSGNEETQKRSDKNKTARRWKVGLAGVAGAAVIGVTGGLAAPLVAGASAYNRVSYFAFSNPEIGACN